MHEISVKTRCHNKVTGYNYLGILTLAGKNMSKINKTYRKMTHRHIKDIEKTPINVIFISSLLILQKMGYIFLYLPLICL